MRKLRPLFVALLVVVFFTTNVFAASFKYYSLEYTVDYQSARSMLSYINDWRQSGQVWCWDKDNKTKVAYGKLSAYTYDYNLEQIAYQRAYEVAIQFSHVRPNGSDWSTCEYNGTKNYGECLALGYSTADKTFLQWREDDQSYTGQGHRRLMADREFTSIGIAHIVFEGVHYWVQEYGYKNSGAGATAAKSGTVRGTIEVDVSKINMNNYASNETSKPATTTTPTPKPSSTNTTSSNGLTGGSSSGSTNGLTGGSSSGSTGGLTGGSSSSSGSGISGRNTGSSSNGLTGGSSSGYNGGLTGGSSSGSSNNGLTGGSSSGYNGGLTGGSSSGSSNNGLTGGSSSGYNSGITGRTSGSSNNGLTGGSSSGYNSGITGRTSGSSNNGLTGGSSSGYNGGGLTGGSSSGYNGGGLTGGSSSGYNNGLTGGSSRNTNNGLTGGSSSSSNNGLTGGSSRNYNNGLTGGSSGRSGYDIGITTRGTGNGSGLFN